MLRASRRLRSAPATAAGALLLLAALPACGDGDPALRVGAVEYSEEQVLGLSEEREERLVELTAVGIAFVRGEAGEIGDPLLDRRRDDLLLERFRAELAVERAGVDDEVLEAQYRTNPRRELVVRHVVALAAPEAPDPVEREAREKAERALERVESGEPFAEVAADLSEEPGAAERGGRLEPGRRGTWVPEFWQAANGLEEGEVSGVVRTQYGFHVIRLDERRTVPFEEVRSEVVLEAAEMLGGVEEAWNAWREERAAGIRVDTAAVRAWREGTADADAALAASPAGPYAAADLERTLAALAETKYEAVVEAEAADPLLELVRDEALRRAALDEARDREIEVPAAAVEQIEREWRTQLAGWSAAVGFSRDAPLSSVASRAREGLSTERQNARIARREIEVRGPLLRSAYPVEGLDGAGPGSGRPGS